MVYTSLVLEDKKKMYRCDLFINNWLQIAWFPRNRMTLNHTMDEQITSLHYEF